MNKIRTIKLRVYKNVKWFILLCFIPWLAWSNEPPKVVFEPSYTINNSAKARELGITQRIEEKNGRVRYFYNDDFSGEQTFLVELTADSLVAYKTQLNKSLKSVNRKTGSETVASYKAKAISRHVADITNQQSLFKSALNHSNKRIKLERSFSQVANVVVVKADASDKSFIESLPNVKRVSVAKRVYKSLKASVSITKADQVWQLMDSQNLEVKGDGITVAILDTGIDYTHPALGGCLGEGCKVSNGWDFVNNDADPMDGDGHGTHVAGIVAAESDDFTGVAPNARLHAYKVLSDEGWGKISDVIAAIEKAVDPDGDPNTDDAVDVINMSLGGVGDADDLLSQATDAAVDAGVIVVVAAGNEFSYGEIERSSPAAARKAITVASSDKDDTISIFSSRGSLPVNQALKPEITAPGGDILSTFLDHGVQELSGTSMASPHIAGIAALLKQLSPELTPLQVKRRLMASAVDLGKDPFAQGAGRVDAIAATDVGTSLEDGLVNFGKINNSQTSWQVESSFTIFNHSSAEKNYQLNLNEDAPSGTSILIDESEITVQPNDSATVTVTLVIENVNDVAYSEHPLGVYYGAINISNEGDMNRIPYAFERTTYLSIDNESDYDAGVFLAPNTGEIHYLYLPPGETTKIAFPAQSTFVMTRFNEIPSEDYSDIIPEGYRVSGLTTHNLQIDGDTEWTVSADSLEFGVGVTNYLDTDGIEKPLEELDFSRRFSLLTSDSIISMSFGGDARADFHLLGEMTDDSSIFFGNVITKLNEQAINDNSEKQNIYHFWYHAMGNELYDGTKEINFTSNQYYSVNFNERLLSEDITQHIRFASFSDLLNLSYNINVSSNVNVFSTPSTDNFYSGLSIYFQLTNEKSEYFSRLVAGTSLNGLAFQNKVNNFHYTGGLDATKQFERNSQLNIGANGTYWNADMILENDQVFIKPGRSEYENAFIADLSGFDYSLINTEYQFICEDTPLETHSLSFNELGKVVAPLPEQTCSKLSIDFQFDNYLDDQVYQSKVSYPIEYLSHRAPLNRIFLWEGDNIVLDQTLNKIKSRIEINVETPEDLAYLSAYWQIEGGEWQELILSNDGDTKAFAQFDMIAGSNIVNMKLNIDGIEQTLNGFFKLGMDAGEDSDVDDDGIDNSVDTDNDNDGVEDAQDAFPFDPSEWEDTDSDGVGNNADNDDDNDGTIDSEDAFPLDAAEQLDTDTDGIGNNADNDDDNDGALDVDDAFPLDATEQLDTDSDGIGNNADSDDDNDGTIDSEDAFPLDAAEQLDTDTDGIGNNAESEEDN
ncbi:MAG: S8 family serine peptidase, partial [Thalassotalea sp.]|nr:S8 family serine peptidase [Thalassotalea sp.]